MAKTHQGEVATPNCKFATILVVNGEIASIHNDGILASEEIDRIQKNHVGDCLQSPPMAIHAGFVLIIPKWLQQILRMRG